MENTSADIKKFEFSRRQKVEMELDLIKVVETLYELPRHYEIKRRVQEYFIQFCYDRNYPIKDAFEYVRPIIKERIPLELKDIVPESKNGQTFFVRGNLFGMLYKTGAIWDEKKTDEMITRFCNITGVLKDFAVPLVNLSTKQRKRQIIETELYDFLKAHVAPLENKQDRKVKGEFIISEFAEALKLDTKYVKGVLRDKKQKEKAERKRIAEYEEQIKKGLPDSPNDNELR